MKLELKLTNTYSKAVLALALSGDEVTVTYSNNRTYKYKGLSGFAIDDLLNTITNQTSLGHWVNYTVKPYYSYEEVTA